MKPVVSSLVALAIAVAPLSAVARSSPPKGSHARVEKRVKDAKVVKAVKAGKAGKAEALVRVKTGKKAVEKVHHAHEVDLAGAGHGEPKVDRSELVVRASATTKSTSTARPTYAKLAPKVEELPRLPSPSAGKSSKDRAENGAREASSRKSEGADDGGPARDEAPAEPAARGKVASTSEPGASGRARGVKAAKNASRPAPRPPCMKDPVEIVRGPEVERFELTSCEGVVAPLAVERLSVLVRPGAAARPTAPAAELAKAPGAELAPGVRRVDVRLVGRIQAIADHFGKPGSPAKLFVISGYRPTSVGSMHASGRAIDFRVEGVKNEDVVTFCKTLEDTGCGYYPNSSFVHVDVRDPGAGHVTWIDASGPGETPRYVPVWPPPAAERHVHRASAMEPASDLVEEGESLLRARRPLEREAGEEDLHPAELPQ